MNLFIYKIGNIDIDFIKKHSSNEHYIEPMNENSSNDELKGEVILSPTKKVPFIIHFKSRFLFIQTNRRSYKRKALKILLKYLKNEIKKFIPSLEKEKQFICSADEKDMKFLHDNQIIYTNKLTNAYCEGYIDEDYYFFEAKLRFQTNENKKITFLYYQDSIKILHEKDQNELINILKIFEKAMN